MSEDAPNTTPEYYEEEEELALGVTATSLTSIMKPVTITMCLACLIVVNVRNSSTASQNSGLSVYLIYKDVQHQSTGAVVGKSIVNALVIVSVMAVATFVIVLCYKFRCLKLLVGYFIFSFCSLLGFSGGYMVTIAVEKYNAVLSWVTLVFVMFNFAMAGVIAIFWQKGIPRVMTQFYLIVVSVIMSWILSQFPVWTAWSLLVVLALYDLCAVLTPCGPLKALIEIAQSRGEDEQLPGLLYEADVGQETVGGLGFQKHPDEAERTQAKRTTAFPTLQLQSEEKAAPPSAGTQPKLQSATPPPPPPEQELVAVVPADRQRRQSLLQNDSLAAEEEGRNSQRGGDEEPEGRSVKLGLGDFVFYSVLVSRAALFDFTTAVTCLLSVLMGLALTLVLLAVLRKALPALPISIALGVSFYFLTRLLLLPYIQALVVTPLQIL